MGQIHDYLDIIVKLIIGLSGLYLANSFRRQIRQKTADGRTRAYSELWKLMEIANPHRVKDWHVGPLQGPLIYSERMELYSAFTGWYFIDGNGMFLGERTRRLYLLAKDNFICPDEELQPRNLFDILGLSTLPEEKRLEKRGELSIRQLSLLRTRMKADLEVYGARFFDELLPEDLAFLKHCGENPRWKPWRRSPSQTTYSTG